MNFKLAYVMKHRRMYLVIMIQIQLLVIFKYFRSDI